MSVQMEALFRPALVLMAGRAVGFVAAFIIPLILARLFDQNDFGTYKQLFLVYGTLFVVVQAGMAESLYYFLPQEGRQGGGYVLNTLLVLATLGSVAVLLLGWQRDAVARLLNNPALAPYLSFIGVYLLFTLMAVVLEIVLTARRRHLAASVAYATTDLARALFLLLPVLLFGGLHWLLLGAVAFAAGRLLVALFCVQREFSGGLRTDRARLRHHLAYALPFGCAALVEVLQVNFHMYVVSWHFDAATFAIYAVGCLQVPLVDFFMTSTSNVMMVNMRARMQTGAGGAAVHAIWLDAVRKLTMILCPLVAALLVVAQPLIVVLFTEAYADSVPVFVVWTVSMLLSVLLTDGVLRVFAQTRFLILQNCLRLALIAALINWFLQHFDLLGAVLVTLLASLVAKGFALARLGRLMQVSPRHLLPWACLGRILGISVLAALPALLLRAGMPTGVAQLLLCGTVYVFTYYSLLLYCGPLQEGEKRQVRAWARQPVLRLCRSGKV